MSQFSRREGRHLFGSNPAAYHRYRPGYPARIFDILFRECGLGPGCATLEIGPGTGHATERLLQLGADPLVAVEPDAELGRFLRQRCEVDLRSVVFEDAELDAASFDLATSATAFHWVDEDLGLRKVAAALRSGGSWACWWNQYGDAEVEDPFRQATAPHLAGLPVSPSQGIGDARHTPGAFASDHEARRAAIRRTGAFEEPRWESMGFIHRTDARGARGLYGTYSAIARLPEPQQRSILDEVERIAREDFSDAIEMPMRTTIYWARRR